MSIGGAHDVIDYTNKSILPRASILESNPDVGAPQILIPLGMFNTKGQRTGSCASNQAMCTIDGDCMKKLPNMMLTEPATCKILDFKREVGP